MLVDELKKSILQQAIVGNLSNFIEEDTSIDEYINVVISNEYIKPKNITSKFEYSYNIPKNWKWVKLGSIVGVYGGKRIPAGRKLTNENTGYKYIRVADMGDITVTTSNILYVPKDIYPLIENYTISKDDLYITVAGTIGKIGFIPEELDGANLTENANKLIFKHINKKWLLYSLISPFVKHQIEEFTTKVGQPKLAIKRIENIELPLPPIEEQQRIVDKIEVLFAKLDEIRPVEEELISLNLNFIKDFRDSLIKSAVSGKLTNQNNEESINTIVKEIENKIEKTMSNIDIYPFELPNNWKWVKFGELVSFNIGKTPPRSDSSYWSKNEYHWVSISDMIDNGFINETKEYISGKAHKEKFKEKISKKGTLLMSFKLTVGRCSILNIDSYHNEGIISIYPNYESEVLKQYLFKILPFMTKFGDSKGAIKGTTLNSKSLNNLLIPLPPIEEQQRIVNKLEQLLPLCNDIEQLIKES